MRLYVFDWEILKSYVRTLLSAEGSSVAAAVGKPNDKKNALRDV